MTWAAFLMALVGLALWAGLICVLIGVYQKARPYVQVYAPLVSGMMPTAAGTGGIENTAVSSPAAALDQCEYGDHEWSTLTVYADGVATHYCTRCGYTEHVPGS